MREKMEIDQLEEKPDRPHNHVSAAVDEERKSGDEKQFSLPSDIDPGTTRFQELRFLPQFIDQTEFMKVVMTEQSEVLFVGAPRGFGKTIKANMMKLFFALLVDGKGNPLTFSKLSDHPNYQYFKDTKIAGDLNFMKQHFGKYPVIHIVFATVGPFSNPSTREEMHNFFKVIVSLAYKEHAYLCDSAELDEPSKESCRKWCAEDFENLKLIDIVRSLADLVNYLCTHHKQPVFIIIDEVDAPCLATLFSAKQEVRSLFNEIADVMSGMLDPVAKCMPLVGSHEDPYIKFYMTGISFTLSGMSAVNNVTLVPFLRTEEFFSYSGFNALDIAQLCKTFKIDESGRERLTKQYNGMHFPGQESDELRIYNPYLVLTSINSAKGKKIPLIRFKSPSFVDDLTKIFMKHEEVSWALEHLILGYNIEYLDEQQIDKSMLEMLQNDINTFYTNNGDVKWKRMRTKPGGFRGTTYRVQSWTTRVLLMFLADIGCFSYVGEVPDMYVCVKLPNQAVEAYFQNLFDTQFPYNPDEMFREKIHAAIELAL